MSDPIQDAVVKLDQLVSDLKRDRLERFNLAWPAGHAERERRMPDDIKQLQAELQNQE